MKTLYNLDSQTFHLQGSLFQLTFKNSSEYYQYQAVEQEYDKGPLTVQ